MDRAVQGLPAISTPNIDSLASNGIRFSQMYAGAPMCKPSRSVMLTGYHQGHTIVDRNSGTSNSMRPGVEDLTYGQVAQASGYRTGYFGKMHMGGVVGWQSAINGNPLSIPTLKGFDDVLLSDGYTGPNQWVSDGVGGMINRFNTDGHYNQVDVTDAAIQTIADSAASDTPFLVTTSYYGVHTNVNLVPQPHDYSAESWSGVEKNYAATLTFLDGEVGRLLAALDDPNGDGDHGDSQLDKTIIVFGSDNGNQKRQGHTQSFFGSTYDIDRDATLRGVKFNVYEGGIRTPFIVQWGDVIKPGAVNEPGDINSSFVGTYADLLPTFAEATGGASPMGIDGVSFLSELTDGSGAARPADYHVFGTNSNEGESKGWAIRMGDWKVVYRETGQSYELYDLASDPSETTNRASDRPEIVTAMERIARAEGAYDMTGANAYFVQYKGWAPAGGSDDFNAAGNWSGGSPTQNADGTGDPAINYSTGPMDNWVATVVNEAPVADNGEVVFVTDDVEVLALQVDGAASRMTVNVDRHHVLGARNGLRIGTSGRVNLDDATVKTMRTVDIQSDGRLSGHGVVTGNQDLVAGIAEFEGRGLLEPHVINHGTVEPGRPGDLPAAAPPDPDPAFTVIDINNGDFEQPVYSGSPGIASTNVIGWDEESPSHSSIDDQVGSLAPGDFTQTGRLHDNVAAAIHQDLGYRWSLGETLTLSFDAWEAGWKIGVAGDAVVFELREVGGALLWDSGVIDLDGTLAGSSGSVIAGAVGSFHTFDIDTDLFAVGTPGSELSLRVAYGGGVAWFDDITLVSDRVESQPNVDLDATGILAIEGRYTQGDDGVLAIDVGGTDNSEPLDASYDRVAVTRDATLAGGLDVALIGGFVPVLGDAFVVLTSDGITGTFDNAQMNVAPLADVGGKEVALAVLYVDSGTDGDPDPDDVRVMATYRGDANGDGIVNPTDLAALTLGWLDGDATWQGGDFNYDGIVNPTDLAVLTLNWLEQIPGGGGGIPEPASVVLLFCGGCGCMSRRRWFGGRGGKQKNHCE